MLGLRQISMKTKNCIITAFIHHRFDSVFIYLVQFFILFQLQSIPWNLHTRTFLIGCNVACFLSTDSLFPAASHGSPPKIKFVLSNRKRTFFASNYLTTQSGWFLPKYPRMVCFLPCFILFLSHITIYDLSWNQFCAFLIWACSSDNEVPQD